MSTNNSSSSGGIGFCGALALLFIGLKLGRVIDWSWWWVLGPLWIPAALVLAIIAVFGAGALGVLAIAEIGKSLGIRHEKKRSIRYRVTNGRLAKKKSESWELSDDL